MATLLAVFVLFFLKKNACLVLESAHPEDLAASNHPYIRLDMFDALTGTILISQLYRYTWLTMSELAENCGSQHFISPLIKWQEKQDAPLSVVGSLDLKESH